VIVTAIIYDYGNFPSQASARYHSSNDGRSRHRIFQEKGRQQHVGFWREYGTSRSGAGCGDDSVSRFRDAPEV